MNLRAGVLACVLALATVVPIPASAQSLPEDAARGLRYRGLRAATSGPCAGGFELPRSAGVPTCTHGPDPAPPGVDVRVARPPRPAAGSEGPAALEPAPPLCAGDGTSGARVQLVYARAETRPDRYDAYAASFQTWARQVDRVVAASAAETGGIRRVRFVHDGACQPVVSRVTLPDAALTDFNAMVTGLHGAGHDRGDRKYLVWMDATYYCGLGSMVGDDRPGPVNGHDAGPPLYARIDSGCWGLPGTSVEAHELVHTLGGVQRSTPHATGGGHCTDDHDLMCYPDGPGLTMTTPCPVAHDSLLDCNGDDYFSTAPAPGSYLADHWNLADSRFLARPPGPPAGLGAAAGEGSASLSWSPPASDGDLPVTGYEIITLVDGAALLPIVVSRDATTHVVEGLANGTAHRFAVAARNSVGPGKQATFEPVVPTAGSRYHPLAPERILDTRSGNGVAAAGRVKSQGSLDVQVTGRGGVPEAGVSAVVLNLTVTDALAAGHVTAWPAGGPRPLASNLNVAAGRTAANLAVVKVGQGGRIGLFNGAGAAHLVADVAGWYGSDGAEDGAGYRGVMPARVLDTRTGNGAPAAKVPGHGAIDLQVAGRGGIPGSGVTAVTLTVTVTAPAAQGHVTAWPSGEARPLASNVNFQPDQTVANAVTVKVGDGGRVSLYNGAEAGTHLVADVAGWYGEGPGGARYHPLTPARVLDTREGNGAPTGVVGLRTTLDLTVRGRSGVPAAGVSSVVMNVTVVDASAVGHLSAWPAAEPQPLASSLNFWARSTVPALVVVRPGAPGAVSLFLDGGAGHLVADLAGWFGAPS